jgi:hypothetical protein
MITQQIPTEQDAERLTERNRGVPLYLPLLALLAFPAFLATGFGSGLGAWQPVPVYVFLCIALLTTQERIAQNRTIAHRTYALLAAIFAALFVGEIFFAVKQFNFTREPLTYLILEGVLLVAFMADTATRHRQQAYPTTLSARFGTWAIDLLGLAVFFYGAAFLMDILGSQNLLQFLGLRFSRPYVVVDLNTLFQLHLTDAVRTLDGLNLVLGLSATAVAFGLLTTAGVVLPSSETSPAYADGVRTFWTITRQGGLRAISSLRLVVGPLIWLIPAFGVAAFADHVAQYFNASGHAPSGILDLFNPLSPTSRGNISLGITTLVLGMLAIVAMVCAIAILEASAGVIWHAFSTFHDAMRAIALSWALFMYSLAAINAVAILVGATKVAPMQVGAPGLIAILVGFGFLIYEGLRIRMAPLENEQILAMLPAPTPLEQSAPLYVSPTSIESQSSTSPRTPAEVDG